MSYCTNNGLKFSCIHKKVVYYNDENGAVADYEDEP